MSSDPTVLDDHASPDRIGIPAAAWALYDFGYSLFAYVVFARYLSDWLISDLDHTDWVAHIRSGEYARYYEQQYGARL